MGISFLSRRQTVAITSDGKQIPMLVAVQRWRTVDEFADEFVADAEFAALGLGRVTASPDGELIAEAASRVVVAPYYRPAFDLAVDALKLAAQRRQSDRRAGVVALASAS